MHYMHLTVSFKIVRILLVLNFTQIKAQFKIDHEHNFEHNRLDFETSIA